MKYFVDTNIFLRVLTKDQKKHFKECTKFLEAVREGSVYAYTSTIVLSEIVWTLGSFYEFPKESVLEALEATLNLKNLEITDDFDARKALELFKQHNVKYIDAVIASLSEIQKETAAVVSFDKDFDKLEIQRMEPKDVI